MDPPLIVLELTSKEAQLLLDLLFVGGEQNVIFMSNKPKRLQWQMTRVKANNTAIVAIHGRINGQMKSQGLPVEYWREVQ